MAKTTRVVFDEWESYVSESDGKLLFISFDVQAAREDLTATLTKCARVIIPVARPNANGGPVPPESERLYAMEDDLCAALSQNGVKCRLVGRLTCDGIRELVFQLDDWDPFRPIVGLWMQDNEDYEIDVSEHDGWTFFDDCLRPTAEVWLYLADQSVVRNLIEAGSDPEKPHALEFVFHGEAEELRQAARALSGRGYAPLGKPNFAGGEIVMVKSMPLDVDAIAAESVAHQKLEQEYGVRYDGWGAAVIP
jgi:regulator of RNase E activity RraB